MFRVLKHSQEFCTMHLDRNRNSGASGGVAVLIPVRYTMTGLSVHSNTFTLCPFSSSVFRILYTS